MFFKKMFQCYFNGNLILQILCGIVLGICVGFFGSEDVVGAVSTLGELFVKTLKSVAPFLVFVLIVTAIAAREYGDGSKKIKNVIILYLVGTFLASVCAVVVSFLFPVKIILQEAAANASSSQPGSIISVFKGLIFSMVENPVKALANGNYIGILTWAIALGFALKYASKMSKNVLIDLNDGTIKIVTFVVRLAPFGIFGLVSDSVYQTGLDGLKSYAELLGVLLLAMFFVAFVLNPLIVFIYTRKNPFPLVFVCIKHSAIYAFFTRSSAANIPVNMSLCERINVDKELYTISIPLGATINMAGAAVTIAVLSLACAYTLGINVSFTQALILSFLAALGACGASGVAGGSLLLIPLACSLFGISEDISMKVVAVGFTIGVIQDSVETAINSSTDVLFSAACSSTELELDKA